MLGCAPSRATSNVAESWQNGYCTGLENRRPKGHGGSNPSLSATILIVNKRLSLDLMGEKCLGLLFGLFFVVCFSILVGSGSFLLSNKLP